MWRILTLQTPKNPCLRKLPTICFATDILRRLERHPPPAQGIKASRPIKTKEIMKHPTSITDALKLILVLPIAWLGLSGFADNIIEWKAWYEVGVMTHWRSFKDLVSETFLFWVPFSLPSWTIDYLILGIIFARSYWAAQSVSFREVASLGTTRDYYIPSRLTKGQSKFRIYSQIKIHYYFTFILFFILIVPIWPLVLIFVSKSALEGEPSSPPIPTKDDIVKDYIEKMQEAGKPNNYSTLWLFLIACLSFIPLLFLLTNEIPKLDSLF